TVKANALPRFTLVEAGMALALWGRWPVCDPVSVHVVAVCKPCSPVSIPRMIEAHEHPTNIPTGAVGANAPCRARVYPHPRSARCRVGGHRPTLAGAPPAGLAQLRATAIE